MVESEGREEEWRGGLIIYTKDVMVLLGTYKYNLQEAKTVVLEASLLLKKKRHTKSLKDNDNFCNQNKNY